MPDFRKPRLLRVEPGVLTGAREVPYLDLVVERAIDAACASFAATIPPGAAGMLKPQTQVRIEQGADLVFQGRVDAVNIRRTPSTGTTVRVGGRDLAADLVDCSVAGDDGEWIGLTVRQIADLLAAPYVVPIESAGADGPPIPVFSTSPGETVWQAIERACRIRGLLAYTDERGVLQIAPPAAGSSSLGLLGLAIQESDCEAIELSLNDADRFRIYRAIAQDSGRDSSWGDSAILVEGNALDTGVGRERRLVVLVESAGANDDAQTRAQWEATVRAARAQVLELTVPGWRNRTDLNGTAVGALWRINHLVPVNVLGINGKLLLSSVRLRAGQAGEGMTAQLQLVRRDAYIPQPELEPKVEDVLGAFSNFEVEEQ